MIRWRNYFFILPVLSAVFLILSFPPWDKGYLAWVFLLPLFFYFREQNYSSWENGFFPGLVIGIIFFIYLFAYLALAVDFLFPRYMGFLVVAVSSLYSAFFFGLFTLSLRFFLKTRNILLSTLAIPASWVLLEYFRSLGFLGHTGGFLGYSQVGYIPLLQAVSLYGYWGLPFLMISFQVVLFISWQNFCKKPKKRLIESASSVLVFLIMLGCGLYLPSLFPVEKNDKPVRIALIQGNITQDDVLDSYMAPKNFQKYVQLTKDADQLYAPLDLIVWPETVFSLNVARLNPTSEQEVADLADETGASILLGAMVEKTQKEVYNSILLQKAGRTSWEEERYDKSRLVPFAEIFPVPEILNKILPADVSLGTYTSGTGSQLFYLLDFTIGGIVCFESYFSRPALEMAQRGAEHLFVLSNDAWFLDSTGLKQHARVAAIRAIETGIGVTQVANTGYTISFDYTGKEVLSLPALEDGIALLETNLPTRQTLYRLWGDYFVLLCIIILLISFIVYLRSPKKLMPIQKNKEN
ncbi:MAG: apolipoprotein N-acyltransferase [Bacillota bacterium]|nr:apolipoprotein N-acyltransferase [Bacillota bacterium]